MISKLNPDTKRVWRPMCLSELAVSSTEFIICEAFNPSYRDFVFSIVDSAAFSDWMCAHTTGSTNSRQRTAPSTTLEFQVALPDEKAITDFCAVVTPMYDTIASNICENQKLAQLRDSIPVSYTHLLGAFLGTEPSVQSAAACCAFVGIAGELASEKTDACGGGTMTFRNFFIDEVSLMTQEKMSRCKVHI